MMMVLPCVLLNVTDINENGKDKPIKENSIKSQKILIILRTHSTQRVK